MEILKRIKVFALWVLVGIGIVICSMFLYVFLFLIEEGSETIQKERLSIHKEVFRDECR